MKIEQSAPSATPLSRPAKGGSAAVGGSDAKEPAAVTAQVRALPAATSGDFDAARVAAIREDIRAGRYEVHPERIADGLLASVRDLLQDPGQ